MLSLNPRDRSIKSITYLYLLLPSNTRKLNFISVLLGERFFVSEVLIGFLPLNFPPSPVNCEVRQQYLRYFWAYLNQFRSKIASNSTGNGAVDIRSPGWQGLGGRES